MEFKQLVITCSVAIGICSCNQPVANSNEQVGDTAVNAQTAATNNYLDSFKQTKDGPAFLKGLYSAYAQKLMADGLGKFDLKTTTDDGKPYKLLKQEEIKLYGGTNPYTLVYVDEIDGAMSSWPWKHLFILDNKGRILKDYETGKFEPVMVFDQKNPLLVVTEETSKGHGVHHFIGIEKDAAKDFLDTQDGALMTINADSYKPETLSYQVKTMNGQKEIVFTGKKNNKPFVLTFTWNSQNNMFVAKNK